MSSGDAQPALLNAFLLTTKDALMVFEAARRGICPVVTRRLHESEKAKMITSGSVFAFDEQATGIKRWTDGALWSPSRIIGNYLIYRELDKKGEKDAVRSSTQSGPASMGASPQQSDPFDSAGGPLSGSTQEGMEGRPSTSIVTGSTGLHRELERALVGSLTTSYRFKKEGLIKKTISNGHLHLISYYTIDDVLAGRLRTPSSLIELASLEISSALLEPKNFRMPPVTEKDADGILRYIGEETDPIGAPPILAPLLAPGAVPGARPMSALPDAAYGLPSTTMAQPYETNDSHLFAYKPAEDHAYHTAPNGPSPHYLGQSQGSYQPLPLRRPDTAQPLWSQPVAEGQSTYEAQPVIAPDHIVRTGTQPLAGPSNWYERENPPYPHANPPIPSLHEQQQQHPPQHQEYAQPFESQPYRSFLHRSHPGVPQSTDHHSLIEPQRPLTQFRRQSYRPPTSNYPYPSRGSDPYARPMDIRPATSPAPSPGVYGSAPNFSSMRGSLSTKPEPQSPALQNAIPSNPNTQYPHVPQNHDYQQYNPPPLLSVQTQSYPNPYPVPHLYTSPSPITHSAPPRTGPSFHYNGTPSQFYEHELRGQPPPHPDQLQEPQSAPAYADNFQQRPSYAGPVRQQRFAPKVEDPS